MNEQLWRCGRCLEHKAASAFSPNGDSLTQAKRPPAYTCKACVKEYQRLRHLRMMQGTWAGAALRTAQPRITYRQYPPRPPKPKPLHTGISFWGDET